MTCEYTPPSALQADFILEEYTVPSSLSADFELCDEVITPVRNVLFFGGGL